MRASARTVALVLLSGLAIASGRGAAAGPAVSDVVFAPHRAVYDLKLDNSSAGSGVAAVMGRIVYELTGSPCEGYAQTMRYVTVTSNQEGEGMVTDLRNSSWESVPPSRLRFSSTNFQNEVAVERTQGTALRERASDTVKVDISRPVKKSIDLSGNIYFPIQHSMAVVRAAEAGQRMLAADLYDGSETGDKVYSTSTVIGRQYEPGSQKTLTMIKDGDKLDRVPSWPVLVSYYPIGPVKGDVLPLYEMSFRFHDNGVTSSLRIDHGEFAIRGDLRSLTYLEPTKCPATP